MVGERGREGWWEGGREGWRDGGREREGGREGGREMITLQHTSINNVLHYLY